MRDTLFPAHRFLGLVNSVRLWKEEERCPSKCIVFRLPGSILGATDNETIEVSLNIEQNKKAINFQ